jgi:hypothetical protein
MEIGGCCAAFAGHPSVIVVVLIPWAGNCEASLGSVPVGLLDLGRWGSFGDKRLNLFSRLNALATTHPGHGDLPVSLIVRLKEISVRHLGVVCYQKIEMTYFVGIAIFLSFVGELLLRGILLCELEVRT